MTHLMPETRPTFKFLSVGRTHVGSVRSLNEDAILNRPERALWAVADGMGGHDSGDVASAHVIGALDRVGESGSLAERGDAIAHVLLRANDELLAMAEQVLGGKTGATVAVLLTSGNRYTCLWAGDSRVYLYRKGELRLLTRDHSVVQEMMDNGVLRADQARAHPQRNVVTRAIGASRSLNLESAGGTILDGDCFLLCSDGLSSVLTPQDIAAELRHAPAERAADRLIARTLSRGAPDNVSLVIVLCSRP